MPRLPDEVSDELLSLAICEELGPTSIGKMVVQCGSLDAVARAPVREWAQALQSRTKAAAVVNALGATNPAEERRRMTVAGLRLVALGDGDYPAQLAQIPVPPIALWMRGEMAALGPVPVAVVGARRATAYGIAQAGRFAGHLAAEGFAVISGGARGIDAEAHRATLRAGGVTVAVLGCGLGETPYPPEHGALYEAIVDSGGLLLSEYPSRWPVLAANFPRRNRVIAGLSMAVVVVEAAVGSGALITARHAHDEQGRPVFAIPGPVDSARSEGCNRAIRDALASIALDPEDIVEDLQTKGVYLAAGARMAAKERAGHGQGHELIESLPPVVRGAIPAVRRLLRKERGADCARVVQVTGLPAHHAQAVLTMFELGGLEPRKEPS